MYQDGNPIDTTAGTILTYRTAPLVDAQSYRFAVEAVDAAGNESADGPAASAALPDMTAPYWPAGAKLHLAGSGGTTLMIVWSAAEDNVGVVEYRVYRDATLLTTLDGSGRSFEATGLTVGEEYEFAVQAADAAGNMSTLDPTLTGSTSSTSNPLWIGPDALRAVDVQPTTLTLEWDAALGAGPMQRYIVSQDGHFLAQLDGDARELSVTLLSVGETYSFQLDAVDAQGRRSTDGPSVTATTLSRLPEDPSQLAPDANPTQTTLFSEQVSFLIEGAEPTQTGADADVLAGPQLSTLRGTVRSVDGLRLPGAAVAVLGHPEFGGTATREDGGYELLVLAEDALTVRFARKGYLSADRQAHVSPGNFATIDDVTLINVDGSVTEIDTDADTMQVARANIVSDADGVRQATLLFPAHTQAELVAKDGTRTPATTLNIRATEYTVGADGLKAMPAPLPPTTAYTYAVELSADEALDADAGSVVFDQPVPFYLENFLQFPTGIIVPVGYYDRALAQWVPSENGRVVKVLSESAGMVRLDVSGNGTATPAELDELGISDDELTELATLYEAGDTLWRVPVRHFTPFDCNWGTDFQGAPNPENQAPGQHEDVDKGKDCPGCIIGVDNQTLGEQVRVYGTPFDLHYTSARAPGRTVSRNLTIPLSGDTVPAEAISIKLEIAVAGQTFEWSFAPAPNLTHSFVWDGKNAYGKRVHGAVEALVRVGYEYPVFYNQPPGSPAVFGFPAGTPIAGELIGRDPTGFLWQTFRRTLGADHHNGAGIGGWSISPHHHYDPGIGMLYRGDGTRRTVAGDLLINIAGTGTPGYDGDGGPALDAHMSRPIRVATAADGTVYFPDRQNRRIRKITPDGVIENFAGTDPTSIGDGGAGLFGILYSPAGMAVASDGSLYIADTMHHRVRKINAAGVISTIVGIGSYGFSGDGGLATAAALNKPYDVAIDASGRLYIADYSNKRIRLIDLDGKISTIVGGGSGFTEGAAGTSITVLPGMIDIDGDDTLYFVDSYLGQTYARKLDAGGLVHTVVSPRQPAGFSNYLRPTSVARDSGAGVYVAETSATLKTGRIIHVSEAGTETVIAGGGSLVGTAADGKDASQAKIFPSNPVADSQGGLYFLDITTQQIRHVSSAGIMSTYAGTGSAGHGPDGVDALLSPLDPERMTRGPDGALYVTEKYSHHVRKIAVGHTITTVAGRADGMQAGDIVLGWVEAIEVGPDGSVYFVDARSFGTSNGSHQVRKIDTKGVVHLVAGTGKANSSGDELLEAVPALSVRFSALMDIAVGADGAVYVTDWGSNQPSVPGRVRRISPDGMINTVVGGGTLSGVNAVGVPALDARIKPVGVAVAPDGSVVFSDVESGSRIRRLSPGGLLTTVAGDGTVQPGDGFAADEVKLIYPWDVDVGPSGETVFIDRNAVRMIDSEGRVQTLAGGVDSGDGAHGGPARGATLKSPKGVSVGIDGSIYIADTSGERVRRVASIFGNRTVPSLDGSRVFEFDANGRHLRTLHGLTKATLLSFEFNAQGHLTGIRDAYDNLTEVERDPDGSPTAIIGPYGQRTELYVDADGYLDEISDALGNAYTFVYDNGLLTDVTNPRLHVNSFVYDTDGMLLQDKRRRGGSSTLAPSDITNGRRVTLTTPLGRTRVVETLRLPDGGLQRVSENFDGLQVKQLTTADGLTSITQPNGAAITVQQGPDPRWGMQVPLSSQRNLDLPSGAGIASNTTRQITGNSDITDPFDWQTLISTLTLNGKSFVSTFDATTRVRTLNTPEGRSATTTLNYAPFGEIIVDTNPGFQPFGFAGGVYDVDTGLTRFGARDYDARAGRWTASDPLLFAGSFSNLYAYVDNDPINYADPSGRKKKLYKNERVIFEMGGYRVEYHNFQIPILDVQSYHFSETWPDVRDRPKEPASKSPLRHWENELQAAVMSDNKAYREHVEFMEWLEDEWGTDEEQHERLETFDCGDGGTYKFSFAPAR